MNFFVRRPWDLPSTLITPEAVYQQRRVERGEFLASLGMLAAGAGFAGGLSGCNRGADEEIRAAGTYSAPALTVPQNTAFTYGRDESAEPETARFTNFYEFTSSPAKDSWRHVGRFDPATRTDPETGKPGPWTPRVDGLCDKPRTFDLDTLRQEFPAEERCYRHRCVETWAMCVPWSGFALQQLLKKVEPKSSAKFVRFESFYSEEECPALAATKGQNPWPYIEGLTLAEAMNELTFLTTGIYSHALPKQNGAPIRVVIPWKYGFKGAKSIVRIKLVDEQPQTFWNEINAREYGFEANVNPEVPHPRWSQRTEWMLGTKERFETQLYNGYGEYVAGLYA